VRHPALEQKPFVPLTREGAREFSPLVARALIEDGSARDVTSQATVGHDIFGLAEVVVRDRAIVAGLEIAGLAFELVDASMAFEALTVDGESAEQTTIARVRARAISLLSAERVALNFLGRLSGIATLTKEFVERVSDLPVRICDTRKTMPGLRELERYAVRAGGGFNHRFNLADAILIKDNHLAAAGSLTGAVESARKTVSSGAVIEVECENLRQVEEALNSDVDAILLDNMNLDDLRSSVAIARGKAILEASGGITLENVRDVALTGVDVISIGALTHSAPFADVALDLRLDAVAHSDE
jgi:nicotinate-nucleotide pyrophosphorylase (carboxylating)